MMARYKYTILLSDGRKKDAEIEAESKADIYQKARGEGATVVDIEEIKKGKSKDLHLPLWLQHVKETEKIRLAKNLSSMLSAGLALSRALDVIGRQSKNPKFKAVIENLQNKIKAGDPFSKALDE